MTDLNEAKALLLDIPEGASAALVEEAAHDVVTALAERDAEVARLRAAVERAEWAARLWLDWPARKRAAVRGLSAHLAEALDALHAELRALAAAPAPAEDEG